MSTRLNAASTIGWLATVGVATVGLTGCGSPAHKSTITGPGSTSPAGPTTSAAKTSTAKTSTAKTSSAPASSAPPAFTVRSPDFRAGGPIPARFTCDGANVAPELRWAGVPANAASLALVVDDPDATTGTFTHWIVIDFDPTVSSNPQGEPPAGGRELVNDTGKAAYFGPCPPSGTHRYRFTLYALPAKLGAAVTTMAAALSAVRATAIAQARLIGTYHR